MPRGGLREPKGGRPPKMAGTKLVKRRVCVKCGCYVGENEHTCKPKQPRPKFRLPDYPPDCFEGSAP